MTHENPSRLQGPHRSEARRKSRAGRLPLAAWAIFFATSVLPSGCLVSPAMAHDHGGAIGTMPLDAGKAIDSAATHSAGCCEEAGAASLRTETVSAPSVERSGWKPLAGHRRAIHVLAVRGDTGNGAKADASPVSPVPTYLVTLRLRA